MTGFATALRIAAAAVLAASALVLSACEGRTSEGESGAEGNPAAAARDFITDGVIDHNGFQACGYLTPRQGRAVMRRAGVDECREAFDDARLTLGRHPIESVQKVRRLAAHTSRRRNHVAVRLGRDGASIELVLVKADSAELEEFQPPDTTWRVARGAPALIPRGS